MFIINKYPITKGIMMKNSGLIDFDEFCREELLTPKRIKAIRMLYGFTQVKFAEVLGINHRTYESWEGGARYPSSPGCALLRIAERYPETFIQNREKIIKAIYAQGANLPNVR
jgi:DNA-binding transcriptional regulator YiaG